MWNATTGQMIAKMEGHSLRVNSAFFSPDGQRLVTASNERIALIFRIMTADDIASLLASR